MSKLLPSNFDKLVTDAVKQFWTGRISTAITSQAGGRGSVISGKNLNAFANLILAVGKHVGFKDKEIIVASKGKQVLPGYFRATKEWDAVVVYKGHLIAAFELKSQVGSFGNNGNNRTEEVLGSATDFWTAHREKGFDRRVASSPPETLFEENESKPPFLGFLMLLEECAKSTGKVKVKEPHFRVRPEFVDASYARRFEILLERLVAEKLYSSTCLLLSSRSRGAASGQHSFPKDTLSPRSFFADFAAKLLAAKETY
jgi:hypothetical protein